MISGTASGQPTLHMRPPLQRLAQAAQPAPPPPAPPPPADAPASPDAQPAPPAPAPDAPPAPAAAPPAEGAAPTAPPANEAPVPEVAPPTEGEIIVVTGSRIGDPLGKQAPVLMMSREDLDRTGLTSVGDILQQLPVSGGAINGKYNSSGNFGSPPDGGGIGAGAVEADLRYLGSKRVLVLVDGVRWVNGSSASGIAASTDLNSIPLSVVERIEVLEDGASPIYGSDAIAGVINIITRKEFNGAMASAYTGGFHKGDGFTQKYDVSWGSTTPRTSIVIGASFLDQRQVSSADRSISSFPIPIGQCTDDTCSSATPQGRVRYTDPVTGKVVSVTLDNGTAMPSYPDTYHGFDTPDRFNFAPYNLVETPSQRISAYSSVIYKLLPTVNINAKASFTNRQSVNQAAPEPLFVGPFGAQGTRMDNISVDATNPYNPFHRTFSPDDSNYFITRRPIEAGPRKFEQNVNTFYVSGGADGHFDLTDQRFKWDATVAYGLNRAEQRRNNSFNSAKLQEALGPAYLGADNQYHCGTATSPDPDANCVPFNIFGGLGSDGKGTITKQMLAFTTFTEHDVSEQSTVDALANLTGNLVQLPAGWLAAAIGIEHRRLSGFFEPDAVVAAGDSADIPAAPTSGSYSVSEAYAELRAPLVIGKPGAELLDVNAAGRISKYSFLDAEVTGKVGARWKPTKNLILRGSYSRGFRAPSLGELHGSKSRFDAPVVDPCSDFGTTTEAVRQRCITLGVPSDGSYEQPNGQISVITNGNIDLKPETSDSFNISLAYSPPGMQNKPWSDSFDVELAYWDIRITDPITALDAQRQLDRCIIGMDDKYCDGILRNRSGAIFSWTNALLNIGAIKSRGVDLTLAWRLPRMNWGRLRGIWQSSYLLAYEQEVLGGMGLETISLQGRLAGAPEHAYPRYKSQLATTYQYNNLELTMITRYIESVIEGCRGLADFSGTCSDPNKTDDNLSTNKLPITVYSDVQVLWTPEFDHRLTVTAGVNNIFNRDPPTCFSCSLNGFNPSTYDVPGIFGYLSAAYHMQ